MTIGTAGKGGCVKIYADFGDLPAFEAKLEAAFEMRKLAQVKVAEQEDGS